MTLSTRLGCPVAKSKGEHAVHSLGQLGFLLYRFEFVVCDCWTANQRWRFASSSSVSTGSISMS
jgi:hypothetical protein